MGSGEWGVGEGVLYLKLQTRSYVGFWENSQKFHNITRYFDRNHIVVYRKSIKDRIGADLTEFWQVLNALEEYELLKNDFTNLLIGSRL